ncbi:MAG: division/cell wall cluster transcriptional repressor MraZ [Fimbriimonadaceae bacterium]
MSSTEGLSIDQVLMGSVEATIDEKGRVLVGKKNREALGESFVLAIGPSGVLNAYSNSVWVGIVKEILSHESINVGVDQYTRLIIGESEGDIRFDAQGRFVVPQRFRAAAKLKDKLKLVGCGNRMEIWAIPEYEACMANPEGYGLVRRQMVERAIQKMKGLQPAAV